MVAAWHEKVAPFSDIESVASDPYTGGPNTRRSSR